MLLGVLVYNKNNLWNKSFVIRITLILQPQKSKVMDLVQSLQRELVAVKNLPEFKAGDTVSVSYKIVEGNKERIQTFQGVVLQRKGTGPSETFTVRKISGGVGVERIFPISSPFIDQIEVNKRGVVRRARIFYLRKLQGKASRIKEKKANIAVAN